MYVHHCHLKNYQSILNASDNFWPPLKKGGRTNRLLKYLIFEFSARLSSLLASFWSVFSSLKVSFFNTFCDTFDLYFSRIAPERTREKSSYITGVEIAWLINVYKYLYFTGSISRNYKGSRYILMKVKYIYKNISRQVKVINIMSFVCV